MIPNPDPFDNERKVAMYVSVGLLLLLLLIILLG